MYRILTLSLLLSLSFISCTSTPKGNLLNPNAFRATINEKREKIVIDVRTPGEYNEGFIKNALNIDWNNSSFGDEVAKLDKSTPVFVYCRSGGRSHSAVNAMANMGFKEIYELEGGIMQWQRAGLPLETKDNSGPIGMSMKEYKQLQNTDKLVLVDFHAPWCGPCKKMAPFLKEIADEQADLLKLHKIDADQNPTLAEELSINSLPTLLLYKNKKLVWSHIGYIEKDELLKKIVTFN